MKQFIISEQEKQRILEMHQNATSRQYLMEGASDTATLFVNEFNRVMAAYKKGDTTMATYTANYNKGIDDYHGTISILENGKVKVTSPRDFGVAITKVLESPATPSPAVDPIYKSNDVTYKLSVFQSTFIDSVKTTFTDANTSNYIQTAIRSGMDKVRAAVK